MTDALLSNEQIIDAISKKSLMDIVNLISAMEEKFGVSAAAPVAMAAPAAAGPAAAAEEQTEFTVLLKSVGDKKIEVIKVIRGITGLPLKEAKDLVETPSAVVKEAVSKEKAEEIKKLLVEVGAEVEVK